MWRSVMETLNTNLFVMETAGRPGLLEQLSHSSQLLEEINSGVNAYLEIKRIYFPRYFNAFWWLLANELNTY